MRSLANPHPGVGEEIQGMIERLQQHRDQACGQRDGDRAQAGAGYGAACADETQQSLEEIIENIATISATSERLSLRRWSEQSLALTISIRPWSRSVRSGRTDQPGRAGTGVLDCNSVRYRLLQQLISKDQFKPDGGTMAASDQAVVAGFVVQQQPQLFSFQPFVRVLQQHLHLV